AGENSSSLATVQVGGDSRFTTGAGNDAFTLLDTTMTGTLTVHAGAGDNLLHLEEASVGGNTVITAGQGNDQLTLLRSDFIGHLNVNAGAGDDKIWMEHVLFGHGATVLAGTGNDYVYLSARALAGQVNWHGNDGTDLIVLDQLPSLLSEQTVSGVPDQVNVDGGRGNDHVSVNLSEATSSILINVHDSNDQGAENLSDVNTLTINGTH